MNSIVYEYDTDEGCRSFRIEYRLHAAVPAGLDDPGEPEAVELLRIRCTEVELYLDNHSPGERAHLVKRHGGVPDSIVTFVPNESQAQRIGDWFGREITRWRDVRDQVDNACAADAHARRAGCVT